MLFAFFFTSIFKKDTNTLFKKGFLRMKARIPMEAVVRFWLHSLTSSSSKRFAKWMTLFVQVLVIVVVVMDHLKSPSPIFHAQKATTIR